MQENILNAFAEQAKTMYAPMAKFNSLFVDNMEKMTEFQLNAIKSYADMGLEQMKKAADVKDAESMRSFTATQAETASALNKKVMDDAKAFSDMAMEFKTQIEGIMEEARSTAAASTTTAKPAAAKPKSAA
ncbi:MAG: phasin family protein [Thalassobium sp.]|jgi:phasin family protein|uniref:Phasin family protein n=1 Tax=Thalassolituus pacificus TaxID=2975440 RepID=A0A9X2WDS2_9GAMM|nr:phasin family protein [Thalassolituus pacificus]MCT7358537.1 phasin family protein [Thalassolituus pacificus]PHS64439.1 MAG: phasin family protein [Thalassobium sp.]